MDYEPADGNAAEPPAAARSPLLSPTRLPPFIRSLAHRNYRIYMSAQIVSLTGSWLQGTALNWLVYTVTANAILLSFVGFAAQIPSLFLGLLTGAFVDYFGRKRTILLMQFLAMVQAFALAALVLIPGPDGQPVVQYWHILALALFGGIVTAFDIPARQTFVSEMVPKRDLGNAVALNSLTFNSARIVGPSVAGLLIAAVNLRWPGREGFGEGVCFLLNGISFFAVLWALMLIRPVRAEAVSRSEPSGSGMLADTWAYLLRAPHILALVVHVGCMALFALPYLVMIPVFAKDELAGTSTTYGSLMSSVGAGAIVGGIVMAGKRRLRGTGRLIAISTCLFAVAAGTLAFTRSVPAACLLVGIAGFFMVMTMIGAQTLVQTLVVEQFRGPVMGIYNMMAVGMMPIGTVLSGVVAQTTNSRYAFIMNSAICLIAGIVLLLRMPGLSRHARGTPEYVQAGSN